MTFIIKYIEFATKNENNMFDRMLKDCSTRKYKKIVNVLDKWELMIILYVGEANMETLYMTDKQKKVIKRLFKMGRTYYGLATDAGIDSRPDKFEDLSYDMAKQIIRVYSGLLGLKWRI